MEIDFGKYISIEDVQGKTLATIDSDVIELVKNFNGDLVKKYEIDISLPNGQKKKYSPNMTSLKALARAYGKNGAWTGKQLYLEIITQLIKGEKKQVIYSTPVVQEQVK